MGERNNELLEWIQAIAIALILSLFIKAFLFDVVLVDGQSMYPTLHGKDRIIVTKLNYRFTSPNRGDIIVFRNPDDMRVNYIKRIIAIEGDRVRIEDGVLFINDEPIDEDYINEPTLQDFQEDIVPEKTVFVLGDNRNYSRDSRDPSIGFIPLKNILGKAKLRIWPLKSITLFK